ncbi:hypothetical protein GCM10010124_11480 [Pilimelia terevasa]|uniref:DUF4360 domain-containing protein n=1 Tax=Pilimelia terevasa TaxID=53372 RepID=A0A8J3BLX4_9ACTN|nr:DUF4360 domain-containing protein [Pilimelia terevasa]GGK20597.1 hypothetical protein GCM10010124_11480 [Pilimelia terevasa]
MRAFSHPAVAVAAATALAVFAGPAVAAPVPGSAPPPGVTMEFGGASGTGCPRGSVQSAVSNGGKAITVLYSEFEASTDAGQGNKRCLTKLKLKYPDGWTYAVIKVDHRGFGDLPKGSTGSLSAGHFFSGEPGEAGKTHQFASGHTGNWQRTHSIESRVYAPCGSEVTFNMNTGLTVDKGSMSPTERAILTLDTTDGAISEEYLLDWKEC